MLSIDLNCDMGEGIGNDDAIMPYISSANIACGYHAGDEDIIRKTIQCAIKHNVAIGAHPGFNDKENFGRLEMVLTPEEIYKLVFDQVCIVQNIAASLNTKLHHVKPHGALYNMAARDMAMSDAIARAVKDIDDTLILYGLNNSFLITEAKRINLPTANEVFADRRYNNNGTLVARTNNNALIENDDEAIGQVLNMVKNGTVLSVDWKVIQVQAETICIHGDGKHAVSFAQKIHEALIRQGSTIKTI